MRAILISKLSICFLLFLVSSCKREATEITFTPLPNLPDLPLKDVNNNIMIGSPISINHNDPKYLATIQSELNAGQSLWYARWQGWSAPKSYDFTELNANINWMHDNGLSPHVHMLVGPDAFMPDWLTLNENRTATELDTLLHDLIYDIMDSNGNKNKVDIWNVVNDLFQIDGTYRKNMIWNQMGWEKDNSGLAGNDKVNSQHPVFIRKAFNYCREKTTKKLELRDGSNYENPEPTKMSTKRQNAVYQLLKHLLNTNTPVDAIGIQGHLTIGNTNWANKNKALTNSIKKFKSLGLEVYITELDAGKGTQIWNSSLAQKQSVDFYYYIKQAIEGGASRINFWGIQDGFDKTWLTTAQPLLWDDNLEKKTAYFGAKQALFETK